MRNAYALFLVRCFLFAVLLSSSCGSRVFGQGAEGSVRVDIARDTWVSNYPSEQSGSNGGAPKLKLKSIVELSIIDFQPGVLKGKQIQSAKLMLKVEGDRPIERVTLSTLSADWIEGDGSGYQKVQGASTFTHRVYPTERWYDSDLTAVSIGQGNTIYASVDAKPSASKGWVELDVPPEILLARIHGLSYGIVLMDDTGSTWTRNGEEFKQEIFPNRFVASKDSNRSSAPYLMVQVGPEAPKQSSSAIPTIDDLRFLPPDQQDPRWRVTWQIEPNRIDELIGFRAKLDGEQLAPFWVPSIRSHDKHRFLMPLDRVFSPNSKLLSKDSTSAKISVQSIDKHGNLGEERIVQVPVLRQEDSALALKPVENLSGKKNANFKNDAYWTGALEGAGTQWSVIDPLDTYVSKTKTLIPAQRPSYLKSNHLFDAQTRTVKLDMARGAWAGFQVISKQPGAPRMTWSWKDSNSQKSLLESSRLEIYTYRDVPSGDQSIPDPLLTIPLEGNFPKWTTRESPAGRGSNWLVETYVPPEVPAGEYQAVLRIEQQEQPIELSVVLRVHDRVIPKTLSFLPEMNCYGLPSNDIDYYRLAQRHRTVVNRVPYGQGGKLADGCAPEWKNGVLDWSAFDRRFSRLFTGEAFEDLPRGKVPIECFYLAMHENWPLPIDPNYNGSYWADQAFPESYRQAWVSSVSQSVDHCADQRWMETRFHVYLNNKNNFKAKGWSRGSSPWLLDEPANFQDYIALRYFGLAFRDGLEASRVAKAAGGVGKVDFPRVVFRADISRPQWQRDTLDEMLKFNVVANGAFKEYESLVLDRKFRFGHEVVIYGGNNPIGKSNATAVAWSWDAWSSGADGILPWQTIGTANSWKQADELSLFYPSEDPKLAGPIPSIRLKAYCYGQQDVEVLHQLAKESGQDRYRFGQRLRKSLQLKSEDRAEGDYAEPATWSDYGALTPEILHRWRVELLSLGK